MYIHNFNEFLNEYNADGFYSDGRPLPGRDEEGEWKTPYSNVKTKNEIVPGSREYLNAGQKKGIAVFRGFDILKPEEYITTDKFSEAASEWLKDGIAVSLIVVFDEHSNWTKHNVALNKYNVNPKYQSVKNGTWGNDSLPVFTDEHPGYKEINFDLIKVDLSPEAMKWEIGNIYIQDKDGNQFCIHGHIIEDAQMGESIKDKIYAGATYLIDKQRGRIVNYLKSPGEKEGIVAVKMQSGIVKRYKLSEFRANHFTELDESKNNNF